MNGIRGILEPTSDVLRSWSQGSFTACLRLLWCVCFCWLDNSRMWSWCGMAVVESRSRSVRPPHWQGFPCWTATDDSFKWRSFQGNWSTCSSLGCSDSWCKLFKHLNSLGSLFCLFFFFLNGSTTFVCLPLINKKRSWMITLFQRHYRQLIKVLGRS